MSNLQIAEDAGEGGDERSITSVVNVHCQLSKREERFVNEDSLPIGAERQREPEDVSNTIRRLQRQLQNTMERVLQLEASKNSMRQIEAGLQEKIVKFDRHSTRRHELQGQFCRDLEEKLTDKGNFLQRRIKILSDQRDHFRRMQESLAKNIESSVQKLISGQKAKYEVQFKQASIQLANKANISKESYQGLLKQTSDSFQNKLIGLQEKFDRQFKSTVSNLEGKLTAQKRKYDALLNQFSNRLENKANSKEVQDQLKQTSVSVQNKLIGFQEKFDGQLKSAMMNLEGKLTAQNRKCDALLNQFSSRLENKANISKEFYQGLWKQKSVQFQNKLIGFQEKFDSQIKSVSTKLDNRFSVYNEKYDGQLKQLAIRLEHRSDSKHFQGQLRQTSDLFYSRLNSLQEKFDGQIKSVLICLESRITTQNGKHDTLIKESVTRLQKQFDGFKQKLYSRFKTEYGSLELTISDLKKNFQRKLLKVSDNIKQLTLEWQEHNEKQSNLFKKSQKKLRRYLSEREFGID